MRWFNILLFASIALAYLTQSQLEILDLHYSIQPKNSNKQIRSFYDILEITEKDAGNSEKLEKIYKKLSRKYHPDKFIRKSEKERKKAERKFQTLSLVINILRDVQKRKNYNYFLKNGFPVYDNNKKRYVFSNRFKPNTKFILSVIVLFTSIGQLIILKLNKSQKNKRINQIIRDVKWKANNMSKNDESKNKIIELSDDFNSEINTDFGNYSVDDKLVTYCGKIFIVKPDSTILLYNDESVDPENQVQMNELVKTFVESGHFNLYGFQKNKTELNRKERRANKKEKSTSSSSDIIDKLVEFKTDDSNLKFSDWYVVKILFGIIHVFYNPNLETIEQGNETEPDAEKETEIEPETEPEQIVKKDKKGNVVLPNGTVLLPRKK